MIDRCSFGVGSQSPSRLVMIVNGTNQYAKAMMEETQQDHMDHTGDSTGKLVAKSRPKRTSILTTSCPTVTSPYHFREWIDVEPGQYDKSCFEVSHSTGRGTRLVRRNNECARVWHIARTFARGTLTLRVRGHLAQVALFLSRARR